MREAQWDLHKLVKTRFEVSFGVDVWILLDFGINEICVNLLLLYWGHVPMPYDPREGGTSSR